jgi:hypothetical protein
MNADLADSRGKEKHRYALFFISVSYLWESARSVFLRVLLLVLKLETTVTEPYLAIQVVMMPRDTNPLGSTRRRMC